MEPTTQVAKVDPKDLTEDQVKVIEAVLDWIKSGTTQEMSVGGYAGTGKTTVIRQLLDAHRSVIAEYLGSRIATVAFTGKAASVMVAKGLPGQTIHSLIYVVRSAHGSDPTFMLVDDIDCDLIIADEASTVNSVLHQDLLSFGVPILWVGDMGQLEPIGDNPNLMAHPDVSLEKIHRQASQSDIIRFSIDTRNGYAPHQFRPAVGRTEVIIGNRNTFHQSVLGADQIMCGYNKTRHATNRTVRRAHGHTGTLNIGERIICLRNNREIGVFNGMICTVKDIASANNTRIIATVEDEAGNILDDVVMLRKQFGNKDQGQFMTPSQLKRMTLWDYGYCVTVHKSQGSEWGKVLVLEELHPSWNINRWRYTAITRASEKLVYCL